MSQNSIKPTLIGVDDIWVEGELRSKLRGLNRDYESKRQFSSMLGDSEIDNACSLVLSEFGGLISISKKGDPAKLLEQLDQLGDSCNKIYDKIEADEDTVGLTKKSLEKYRDRLEEFSNSGSCCVPDIQFAVQNVVTFLASEVHNYQLDERHEYIRLKPLIEEAVVDADRTYRAISSLFVEEKPSRLQKLKNFFSKKSPMGNGEMYKHPEVPEIPAPLNEEKLEKVYNFIVNQFYKHDSLKVPTKGPDKLLIQELTRFKINCHKIYSKLGQTPNKKSYSETNFDSEMAKIGDRIYTLTDRAPDIKGSVRGMLVDVAREVYKFAVYIK
jgi:hypothetical protein